MSEQDTRDQFAFKTVDRLIGAGIVLRENRASVAHILAEELDKHEGAVPVDGKHDGLEDGYAG